MRDASFCDWGYHRWVDRDGYSECLSCHDIVQAPKGSGS